MCPDYRVAYYLPLSGQKLRFDRPPDFRWKRIEVPCGRCLQCRKARAGDWVTRMMCEWKFHERGSFLTLQFRPENRPPTLEAAYPAFQRFMSDFRKEIAPCRVRYAVCGEHGPVTGHPHFHALIFGWQDHSDWEPCGRGRSVVYRSAFLDRFWAHGHVGVGPLEAGCIAYVAGHAQKALIAPAGRSLFRCSNRPGMGRLFVERYARQGIYSNDAVIFPGPQRRRVPRYFDRAVLSDEQRFDLNLQRSLKSAQRRAAESSQARREACEVYERLMLERRMRGEPTYLPRGKA